MTLPEKIAPAFTAWLAQQSDKTRAMVESRWEATASDPTIAIGHRNAAYARATLLLDYCRAELGYDG